MKKFLVAAAALCAVPNVAMAAGWQMDPNGLDSRGTMDPDGYSTNAGSSMDPNGLDSRGAMDPDGYV